MADFKYSDYGNIASPANLDIVLFENAAATNSFNTTFAQLKTAVIPTVTNGAITFGAGGVLSEDPTQLFWDNANNHLGIGTTNPIYQIHVSKASTTAGIQAAQTGFTGGVSLLSSFSSQHAQVRIRRGSTSFQSLIRYETIGVTNWFVGLDTGQTSYHVKRSAGGSPDLSVRLSDGNVGIGAGAANPTQKLVVDGNCSASSYLTSGAEGGYETSRAVAVSTATTASDVCIGVTDVSALRTITLSDVTKSQGTATRRRYIEVKDQAGTAGAGFNISVSPESGSIDGAASINISTSYGSLRVYSDGTNWFTSFG